MEGQFCLDRISDTYCITGKNNEIKSLNLFYVLKVSCMIIILNQVFSILIISTKLQINNNIVISNCAASNAKWFLVNSYISEQKLRWLEFSLPTDRNTLFVWNFHFATYFPLQPLNITLDAGRIEINAHLATQGYYDN